MLLHSPRLAALPGLRHGFATRLGGVSAGPYATWNMGGADDDPAAIRVNRARFAGRLGLPPEALVQVDQVHGVRVLDATEAPPGTEADGLVTADRGTLVAVRTADCAPILMAATDAAGRPTAVAAVHAGWRGATGGIVAAGVRALVARGASPARIVAAVGPTIGFDAFEVGEEVVEAARDALGGDAPRTKPGPRGRPHLDLVDLVQRLLHHEGVETVDLVGGCTVAQPALFYSHRRDAGVTGRHVSGIALAGPEAP